MSPQCTVQLPTRSWPQKIKRDFKTPTQITSLCKCRSLPSPISDKCNKDETQWNQWEKKKRRKKKRSPRNLDPHRSDRWKWSAQYFHSLHTYSCHNPFRKSLDRHTHRLTRLLHRPVAAGFPPRPPAFLQTTCLRETWKVWTEVAIGIKVFATFTLRGRRVLGAWWLPI